MAVAEKLLSDSAFYDDVASRAYFAVYHAAQALLTTEGLEADTHRVALSTPGRRCRG
jgi:uncharacterized protein (UPF0332 family)